jgi:ABC-type uncharacterized transport system YnjBCD substrate-binding protein
MTIILAFFALAATDVVPWILTGLAATAAFIAALANRSAARAQHANVSTEAFEAVTRSQATYNLALSKENGMLRERLRVTEEKCRADNERFEAEIATLEAEVKTLQRKVDVLERDGP